MREPLVHHDELYVGYLPVPPGIRRFLIRLIPAAVLAAIGVAIALGLSRDSPGNGAWHPETSVFRGMLLSQPYPMLLPDPGSIPGGDAPVLLVSPGKHGGQTLTQANDAQRVSVTGTLLSRDGLRMLEVIAAPTPEGMSDAARKVPPVLIAAQDLRTLVGEIVDSKCYLGAMKPGEGRTHKECATLCVAGGIPPVFVTRDDSGLSTLYLLSSADGGPLNPAAFQFIADPVEVSGRVYDLGGLKCLAVAPADIHRR